MSPSTETQLLDAIVDLAKLQGWWLHHDRPARTERGWRTPVQGNAGFPDLVLARDGMILFRELKGRYDKLSAEQHRWSQRLAPGWLEAPRYYFPEDEALLVFDVWRPQHWDTRIRPFLSRARRRHVETVEAL